MTVILAAYPEGLLPHTERSNLAAPSGLIPTLVFMGFLAAGFRFTAYSVYIDIDKIDMKVTTFLHHILFFVSLLIALGSEFANDFHDTANPLATVIYTHSLPAKAAVAWSGFFNFLRLLTLPVWITLSASLYVLFLDLL